MDRSSAANAPITPAPYEALCQVDYRTVGFSFGELVFIALVALIVIGPKDLPRILRAAGKTIGTIKRTISEVRRETGLDEVLRGNFEDLERLADHIERMEVDVEKEPKQLVLPNVDVQAEKNARREREYPRLGADSYGLLPEDSQVYPELDAYATANARPEGVLATGAAHGLPAEDPSTKPVMEGA